MPKWELKLTEWLNQGLIDADAVQRISAYESNAEGSGGLRWPALIALAFGGVLLAAGV